jgi:hypothetical protein
MASKNKSITHYGPAKYAALHLLLCRWMRLYAANADYAYVTLGGTELRDIESMAFIDEKGFSPAVSFEEDRTRFALAEKSAAQLENKGLHIATQNDTIFNYDRVNDGSHCFFFDFEGVCAWADYHRQFGDLFSKGVIQEGDAFFITSHLGHNPGWPRVFETFDAEFRALKIFTDEKKRLCYRAAHPSFTLYKALHYANLTDQIKLECIGHIQYRDKTPMGIYGYIVSEGRTEFVDFVEAGGNRCFDVHKGNVPSGFTSKSAG